MLDGGLGHCRRVRLRFGGVCIGVGHRVEELHGVVVLRVLQDLLGCAALDNAPVVEDEDLVGDHARAEQVMGDVQQRQPALEPQVRQQLEHTGP